MTNESPLHNEEQHRELIERRAYDLWEERGRPWGTPELDWFAAEEEMSAGAHISASSEPSTIAAAKVVGSVLGSVAGLVTSIVDSVQSGLESLER